MAAVVKGMTATTILFWAASIGTFLTAPGAIRNLRRG